MAKRNSSRRKRWTVAKVSGGRRIPSPIAYEEADLSPVEPSYIVDPLEPNGKPVEFRYPRAGTANADVRLGVVPSMGGATTWIPWDTKAYPYLTRVEWPKGGPLALMVENRAQTEAEILPPIRAAAPRSICGPSSDAAWSTLPPPDPKPLPHWLADGSGFLWVTERNGQAQLERTMPNGKLDERDDAEGFPLRGAARCRRSATAGPWSRGGTDRLSHAIYRFKLTAARCAVAAERRDSIAASSADQHAIFADRYNLMDGTQGVVCAREGKKSQRLPSVAEAPPFMPKPEYFNVGSLGFDALVMQSTRFRSGKKYPVILSVYSRAGREDGVGGAAPIFPAAMHGRSRLHRRRLRQSRNARP